jgi:uncharacterized protein (TIGR03435 family)
MQKPSYLLNLILFGAMQTGILAAQSNTPTRGASAPLPAFDAVSIKRVDKSQFFRTASGSTTITTPQKPCEYSLDRVVCQLSLKYLIEEAFQLKKSEMAGLSGLDDELFLVQAILPLNTDKEAARLMLQQTLEERFGLKFHHEERVIPIYALIPGKQGVKLQPADDPAHRKLLDVATPVEGRKAVLSMSPGQFSAVAMSLDVLANDLNSMADMDLPVINMTGLTREYKIDLHWNPVEEPGTSLRILDPGFPDAVESQLGLKLEKRKVPSDVFVVDQIVHVPTEN